MRQLLLFALVVLLSFSTVAGQARKMDSFSGSWLRDEAVQQDGLVLARVTWQVAFDEKVMTLTERNPAGTVARTVRYNLDGTETKESKPERVHKFRWDSAKQVIQLSATMFGSDNPPTMGMIITETWQLTDGGKILKVLRELEPTDKTIPIRLGDARYSFHRIE